MASKTKAEIYLGDCLKFMQGQSDNSFDLTVGSPPYEDARTYDLDFRLRDQDWVDWMVSICQEAMRVTNGLVAFVVCGRTRHGDYSCTPEMLTTDLHRAGHHVFRSPLYVRHGIPGSGGSGKNKWLSNKYEFIICCSKYPLRELPYADPLQCGHRPKHKTGGAMSNRHKDGERANARTYRRCTPKLANPGNLIDCGAVGGHNLGSKLAHDNEAPYPIKIPKFMIQCFCKPGGTVYDPFSGSGTTAEAAITLGRHFVGTDVRQSQVKLTRRRIASARKRVGFGIL